MIEKHDDGSVEIDLEKLSQAGSEKKDEKKDDEFNIETAEKEAKDADEKAKREAQEKTEKEKGKEADKTGQDDDPINSLKRQLENTNRALEAERLAKAEAEKLAKENAQKALQFSNEKQKSDHANITNAIAAVQGRLAAAKNALAKAMAEGEYEKAADAQEEISKASAYSVQLEQGKSALEAEIERAKENPIKVEPTATEKEEAFLKQYSPQTQEWLRKNPSVYKDNKQWQRAGAIHNLALAEGIPLDTPEYFDFVETKMGMKKAPEAEANDPPAKVTQPKKPVGAPPSGAASTTGGDNPKSIRLSKAEVEIAESMGMPIEEYARNKLALQKEGRITT